jgi:hypothetical protein
MANFSASISEYARKTKQGIDDAVKDVINTLHAEVDRRSPVGNPSLWKGPAYKGYVGGHFRANNQYKFGSVPEGEIPGVDPSGANSTAAARAAIASAPVVGVHYIANNVPYARALEEGHSQVQAPQGVYGLTVRSVANNLKSFGFKE